jgi:hypothetical protein
VVEVWFGDGGFLSCFFADSEEGNSVAPSFGLRSGLRQQGARAGDCLTFGLHFYINLG